MGVKILVDPGHFANYNRSPVVKEYYEGNRVWVLSQYLIEELKKYDFEKVACTKPSINSYPKNSKGDDIYARGKMAKGYNVLLSIHSNACGTESVNRAVVIYPINNTCKDLADKLGATIKNVMGLSSYQNYSKKGSNGNYYGVIRGAAAVGVPALILEHGFHTNTAVAKWLMSDANLRKLAEAEAKVVAAYYGVSKKGGEVPKVEKTEVPKAVYRVRTSWNDVKGQKGAFGSLDNAKALADKNPGYNVYNAAGECVYSTSRGNKVQDWQNAAIADGYKFPEYGADGEWGSECEGVARKALCYCRTGIYTNKNLTKFLQKQLGLTGTALDGKFGAQTEKLVIAFQEAHGLAADGIVGLNTWKTILDV